MPDSLRASVVVIGDEVLGGFVRDTNSGWLAGRLHHHGIPLDRVHTVPDDHAAIGEALSHELARSRPRVVFTSGGVGSTPDDLTVEAVARCLGVDVVVLGELEARITRALERSAAQGVTTSADHEHALRRMARAPAGAYVLPTGGFGGLGLDVDGGVDAGGVTLVILPGIPSELERIVTEGVEPILLAGRGRPQHVSELRHPLPESLMNPALHEVIEAFPGLHVGSYPGKECVIRLTGQEDEVEQALVVLRGHLARLQADPQSQHLQRLWQSHWAS